jgi:hypothetical protein
MPQSGIALARDFAPAARKNGELLPGNRSNFTGYANVIFRFVCHAEGCGQVIEPPAARPERREKGKRRDHAKSGIATWAGASWT